MMRRGLITIASAALAAALAGPAAAGELYSWQTAEGGIAFTDDPDAIPPRYKEAARKRNSGTLAGYRRYTPSDGQANAAYEKRLGARLDYLRRLNAASDARAAAEAAPTHEERVTLRTGGGAASPSIDLPAGRGDEPVVVEQVFLRRRGSAVIQPAKVVRRGDRVISIIKPRAREWNITSDFIDEEELLESLRPE